MQSSINNGGSTHVKYGHTSRPRLLEVACPSCGYLAKATKPSETKYRSEVVGDLSPSYQEDDWEITCLNYPKRISGVSYNELPKLFYSGGQLDIWAWNSDHASCIIDYLSGEDTSENPYNWFMTYLRGTWKRKPKKRFQNSKKCITKPCNKYSR